MVPVNDLAHPFAPVQIDVTAAVHAQRQLQQAHALLAEEKVHPTLMDALAFTDAFTLTDALSLMGNLPKPEARACFFADGAHQHSV